MAEPTEMLFGVWPKKPCNEWKPESSTREEALQGQSWVFPDLPNGQYSESYMLGGGSDAACGYQSTVAIFSQ